MIYCQDCCVSQPAREKRAGQKYINKCKYFIYFFFFSFFFFLLYFHTQQKGAHFSKWLVGNFIIKKEKSSVVCVWQRLRGCLQRVAQRAEITKTLTFIR